MPFYTGKTADGSDMKEVHGAYVNPNNDNEWSSKPYPEQQKKINIQEEYSDYVNGRFCLDDVYKQILAKTCPLPVRARKYVLSHYDENGKFLYEDDVK